MKQLVLILLCFLPVTLFAQTTGPEKGTLVIVGGNAGIAPEIFERFVELAGGKEANIVIIPTAGGRVDYDKEFKERVAARFLPFAPAEVHFLHTTDPAKADTDAFIKPLQKATGVWFTGGRQWRLADAYLGTKTEKALWAVLARDGVIGGSSAGATIQGSYLVRGDTKTNTIMMGDHEEGFGFLKNVGIDQHLLRRNRQFDLIEVIEAKPELLGIGIDEGTGIVVRQNEMEVIGLYYVAIYDANVMTKARPFYFLAPGDRFDLKKREQIEK